MTTDRDNEPDSTLNERKFLMETVFPKSGRLRWEFIDPGCDKELVAGASVPDSKNKHYNFSVSFGEDTKGKSRSYLYVRLTKCAEILAYCPITEHKAENSNWISKAEDGFEREVMANGGAEDKIKAMEHVTELFRNVVQHGKLSSKQLDPALGL